VDYHPELAGYEPSDGKPLRSPAARSMLRCVVVLGVIALVLPEVFTTASVANATAQASCLRWVAYQVPEPSRAEARFELFGPGFIGWECYSVGGIDGDQHIASLGLIPSPPTIPARGTKDS
jgi:hypothetical protein